MKMLLKYTGISLLALSVSAHAEAEQSMLAKDLIEHLRMLESNARTTEQTPQNADLNTAQSSGTYSHFVTHLDDFHLRGEKARFDVPVYLLKEDVASSVDIEVAFLNSAVVRPDASNLKLYINGLAIGSRPIKFAGNEGILSVTVPSAILKRGKNMVSIVADQMHRVDCSYEGTFDLWTRINPANTRIIYNAPKRTYRSLRDLAARPLDIGAAQTINLLMPKKTAHAFGQSAQEAYLGFLQKIVLEGHYKNPRIAVSNTAGTRLAGSMPLDVFVGSQAELLQLPGIQSVYAADAISASVNRNANGVAIVPSIDGKRHLVMQLNTVQSLSGFDFSENEENDVLETSEDSFEERFVRFAEAGYVEEPHFGKHFTASVDVDMPSTFYPSDYDTVKLHLFAGYASDLAPKQSMLIRVNDVEVASLALQSGGDNLLENKVVELPLSRFAPGKNKVEIIAQLDTEQGSQCNYGRQVKGDPSFYLSGETFFTIPKLAKLKRFPDIENTLATGFPYRQSDERGALNVSIDHNSNTSFQLAAEFIARTAINAEQVLPVRMNIDDAQSNSNRLVVAPYSAVPQKYAQHYDGVNFAALDNFWSTQFAAADLDAMNTAAMSGGLLTSLPNIKNTDFNIFSVKPSQNETPFMEPALEEAETKLGSFNDLKARFKERAQRERDNDFEISFNVTSHLSGITSTLKNAISWDQDTAEKPTRFSAQETNLVISQFADDNAVTTLIAYPSNQLASLASFNLGQSRAGNLTHSMGFNVVKKQTIKLQARGFDIRQVDFSSMANLRLVIAGWLSNNPIIYGSLFIFLLLGCGSISSLMLRNSGRRTGKDFDRAY